MSEASAPVVRTVKVHLSVPPETRASLHDTIEAFNAAVSFAVERAPSPAPSDETMREAAYEDVLARNDLPRRLALRACAEAADYLRRREARAEARAAAGRDGAAMPTPDGSPSAVARGESARARPAPHFDHPSVAYDAESFTPRGDSATLGTVDGAVEVAYDPAARQRAYLTSGEYTATDGVLHYVTETDAFYLQLNLRRRPTLA